MAVGCARGRRATPPSCLAVAALLAGLLAGLLLAAPAAAELPAPQLAPSAGPAGTTFTLAGDDCRRRGPDPSQVRIVGDSLGVDMTVSPATDGTWSAEITVDAGAAVGPHVLTAICIRKPADEAYAPVTFTVELPNAVPTSSAPPPTTAAPSPPPTSIPVGTPAPGASNPSASGTPTGGSTSTPTTVVPGAGAPSPSTDAPSTETAPTPDAADADETTGAATDALDAGAAASDQAAGVVEPEPYSPPRYPLVIAAIGSAVVLLVAFLYLRRRLRPSRPHAIDTGVALAPPSPDATVSAEPHAVDTDRSIAAAMPPRAVRPPCDVAHAMVVLEPVLRAAIGSGITFTLDITTDELVAAIGPHELETVVGALVERAAATLPDGGTIRVVAGSGPCAADPRTAWALVVVADTGPGVPSDVVANLRGRGPGEPVRDDLAPGDGSAEFATVLAALGEIGGHLDITSVPGHGTTVTVAFPLCSDTASGDAASADTASGNPSSGDTAATLVAAELPS